MEDQVSRHQLAKSLTHLISYSFTTSGCSSLDGFFYEQGPFELIESSASYAVHGVALKNRDFRWNRIANMLFIEQPVGVGFSYGDRYNAR